MIYLMRSWYKIRIECVVVLLLLNYRLSMFLKVRHHEQDEEERERLNELQDMKEAEELAKQEARGILSLASE